MNQFLLLLVYIGGSITDAVFALFWISIAVLVIPLVCLIFYLQRKELRLTSLFQYSIPLSEVQLSVLKEFPFYHSLHPIDKVKFEKRVQHFLVNKKFVPHEMPALTEEMKISVAIAWTRLVFGHRPFYLSHFKTIHLYPSYPIDFKEIKKRRQLIVSWKEFQEGHHTAPLATALIVEELLRQKDDRLFAGSDSYNWHVTSVALADSFTQHVLKQPKPLEEEEFFILAVVYFFEHTFDFQKQFPTLYTALSELLKTDPLPVNSLS